MPNAGDFWDPREEVPQEEVVQASIVHVGEGGPQSQHPGGVVGGADDGLICPVVEDWVPGLQGLHQQEVLRLLGVGVDVLPQPLREVAQGLVGVGGEVELLQGVALLRLWGGSVPLAGDEPPHRSEVQARQDHGEVGEDVGERVGKSGLVSHLDGDLLGAVLEVGLMCLHGNAADNVRQRARPC